jgi:hypothetical protein
MTRLRFGLLAASFLLTAALVTGCAGIPQDGRYQDHDGGRSNTRAEAPAVTSPRPC